MATEIQIGGDRNTDADLVDRALNGAVFVIRGAFDRFHLFETLITASLDGIRKSVGKEAAQRAEKEGFEHIHEWVAPADIPAMTDAVYDAVKPLAPGFLKAFVQQAFPAAETLYYEETPNVRFHIPYDLARAHKDSFKSFSKDHGEGKITAHGPHRDSWLDCPSNGINLWFAIGPVRKGNGLTVYEADYQGDFVYKDSGDIADGEKLHRPTTFDLEPGDCVMFHTDQVHGSELNRINETRFVISFRMSFGKPVFPNRHYHKYVNANMVGTPLESMASVPATMQASYVKTLPWRLSEKLSPRPKTEIVAASPEAIGVERDGKFYVPLEAAPVGSVRGVNAAFCVARISDIETVAFSRRCPHSGGDFANGWVHGGAIVCPWHNLPFNAETGRSPCKTLAQIRKVSCDIIGGEIVIDPTAKEAAVEAG